MGDAVKIVIDLTANPAAAESLTAAFKRVQQSGKQAADGINAEFGKLGNAFKGIGAQLAGALGLAAIGLEFKKMVGDVMSSAVALDKLAQQTGLSTRALQGLHEAARQTETSREALDSGLQKLTLNLGKAANGATAPRQAIAELGLSFSDLRRLSPDDQFTAIASALAKVNDPAQQARIGVALFGKSFQDIQQVVQAAAKQGLQPFIDKLQSLGVLLSDDMIQRMKDVRGQLADIGLQAQGVVTQFLSGLIPSLQSGLAELLKSTNGVSSGFADVGSAIGAVFKTALGIVIGVGKTIGIRAAATVESFRIVWKGAVDYVADLFDGLGRAITLALRGHLVDASNAMGEGMKNAAQAAAKAAQAYLNNAKSGATAVADAWKQTFGSVFKAAATPAAPQPKGAAGVGADLGNLKALASARYALLQTELANELALFQAQAKLRLTTEAAAWEQGTVSLKTYFADRAAIINQQYDLEIAGIKAKLASVAALPTDKSDPAAALQRQNQLMQLQGQLQVKQIQRETELAQLTAQQQQAQRQLFTDRMNAEAKLALLQGNRFAAEKAQLAVQLQSLDLELRRAGVADTEREAALALAREQGTAKANFDQQAQGANAALSSLNVGIAAIQNRIANGQLWQVQGEQQIIALEKQRLPLLEKIGAAMTAFAAQSKNPDLIAQAEAFNQRLADIRTSADLAGRQMAQFKADVQDAFSNGLEDFLASGINQVHGLADAFRQLGLTIAQALQAAAAKQLANALVQKFSSMLGKGGDDNGAASLDSAATKTVVAGAAVGVGATLLGTSADKLMAAAGALTLANAAGGMGGMFAKGAAFFGGKPITAFATGGVITAPTFFPLRNGPGLMGEKGPEAIMPLHKMWDGKLGVRAARSGDAAPAPQVNLRINNSVDPNFVTDTMAGPAGEKVVMNIISRNQMLLKRTFGG